MANLTEERIRERDEAMRAFDSARPPQRLSHNPAQARTQIAAEKNDIARDRMEQDAAFKQAELSLKAEQAAQRALAAESIADIRKVQTQVLQDRLANETLANEVRTMKAALDAGKERQALEHAKGYLAEVGALDLDDPKWNTRMTQIAAKYPTAFEHKSVQETDRSLRGERELRLKIRTEKEKEDAREKAAREAALAAGMKPDTIKAGDVTFKAPDTNPLPAATITETTDDAGKVKTTTTRKVAADTVPAEQRAALLAKHNELEGKIMAKAGSKIPDMEEIAAINAVKGQLGYRMLGANGQPVQEQPGAAPQTVPAVAPVAGPPVVASASDFDSLPPGSEFVWNGRRGKKP